MRPESNVGQGKKHPKRILWEDFMAKELKKRSEVAIENTWKLEDMYATPEDWEKDLERLRLLANELKGMQGTVCASAENLLKTMQLEEAINKVADLAYNYAARGADTDTTDTIRRGMEMRIRTILAETEEMTAFLSPELLQMPQDTFRAYLSERKELEVYEKHIMRIFRKKAHFLDTQQEALLAAAGEVTDLPNQVFSMMVDADLVFPEITDENGEQVRLTHGRYIPFMLSGDRRVRKDAFTALYATYRSFRNTFAAMYAGQTKAHRFQAKARKYDSCLEAATDANNVPTSVYTNLIETVHNNMDKMYRYVALRKKILGVDELHMYDLYVPLVKEADAKVPYEKAKTLVLEALKPLGKEYCDKIAEGFANRWIDVYENVGKTGGAYSAGAYGTHPYVLLNYNDTLDDVFTVAHEMGHAMHSYLSNSNQPCMDAGYVIFVAEVASTCNEVLLMQYLLGKTTDRVQRAYLINNFLESFRTTLYRQTMFAEFELLTHEMCEKGESLTSDTLSDLYLNLNRLYFGDGMTVDSEIAMEWARIPHFYYNFYVYQYATGFSAAVSIANRILKEGEPAVADYLRFLSSGCTASPIELLKIAGVDMNTPQPINEALAYFNTLLDEMEELLLK